MKCTIPEISWHNRDPVLSIDIQVNQEKDKCYRVVTGGADSHVFIWYLTEGESGIANVEFASDLSRHQKAVNVVRFSPNGEMLASGDDESTIIVWKQKTDQDLPEFPANNMDEENINKEHWVVLKILRGHLEDVYDISWSPRSTHLISGSVDNTAIIWNVHKGKNLGILSEHRKFVQGVAWDPKDQYAATLSSDRHMRIYSVKSRRVIAKASRAKLPVPPTHELHEKLTPLFHDDTMRSFFRRLCFTPDGSLLIAPSGVLETQDAGKKPTSVTHVFTRANFHKPAVCLPSLQHYSVAVKCCPLLFQLKPSPDPPLFKLPYRMVIAVATEKNILLYDTQHATPFAFIANTNYAKLTDITWSSDGHILIASSTDGYCSIISFGDRELGVAYVEEDSKENVPEVPDADKKETGKEKDMSTSQSRSPKEVKGNSLQEKKTLTENISESNKPAVQDTPTSKTPCETLKQNDSDAAARPDSERPAPTTPRSTQKTSNVTPNKTPRRVQLITLSSPNRKRKLHEEKIKDSIQENDAKKLANEDTEMKSDDSAESLKAGKPSEIDSPSQKNQKDLETDSGKQNQTPDSDFTKDNKEKISLNSSKEKTTSIKQETDSPSDKTMDFDFDSVLENTGDSIINPSFVDDSPKAPKSSTITHQDFSQLKDSLDKSQRETSLQGGKQSISEKSNGRESISEKSNSEKSAEGSSTSNRVDCTSPSRDPGAKPAHVFTPPRTLSSPGRRVKLITLSSPKVKSKEK